MTRKEDIEKSIKSFLKKSKYYSFSTALLVTFLITGHFLYSQETLIITDEITETVPTRKQLDSEIIGQRLKINKLMVANKDSINRINIKMTQLLEQGQQVIKPWDKSWQLGANYYYKRQKENNQRKYYPYNQIYKRNKDIFVRSVRPYSKEYQILFNSTPAVKANTTMSSTNYSVNFTPKPLRFMDSTDKNTTDSNYLINPTIPKEENNEIALQVSIKPQNPKIESVTLQDKNIPNPPVPKSIKFTPAIPKVVIPANPSLPVPPTFAVVLGADCNHSCSSNGRNRQQGRGPEYYPAHQNVDAFLHYTWSDYDVPIAGAKGLAFKMYAETYSGDFILGTKSPTTSNNEILNTKDWYFNSYNTWNTKKPEFENPIEYSYESWNEKNHQYFFVGGSRFIEADNTSSLATSPATIEIPEGNTLHLGGILTLGLVSQGDAAIQLNNGTITDREEKNDPWIINMPYTDGQNYLLIKGPTEDYYVKRSHDGYVGYKVAIALVQEQTYYNGKLINNGEIDFRGTRSIGEYIYLPKKHNNATIENNGKICLSGNESYGIKVAAETNNSNSTVINNNLILLRKNPDGEDRADGSVGIALMEDASVTDPSFPKNATINKGNITLENVANSSGVFINLNTNIINEGKIIVNSEIPDLGTTSTTPTTLAANSSIQEQAVNIGMRSEKGNDHGGSKVSLTGSNKNAEVINRGLISIDGKHAIGMLANSSNLVNTGTITSDKISNGVGLFAIDGSNIENSGSIKVVGEKSNIGIFLNNSSGKIASIPVTKLQYENVDQNIEVSGDKSTGVLMTADSGKSSTLSMKGDIKVTGASEVNAVVLNNSTLTTEGGTITLRGKDGSANKSTGIIIKGNNSSLTANKTNLDISVTGKESLGIYAEGNITATGKISVDAEDGAMNFYSNGSTMTLGGDTTEKGNLVTGHKSLLFNIENSGKILIKSPIVATIKGEDTIQGQDPINMRGTAFNYKGTDAATPTIPAYGKFTKENVQRYFNNSFGDGTTSTLNNLTLKMEKGARLFVATNIETDLTNTGAQFLTTLENGPSIQGQDYKTFMLYLSKLTINKDVNLDNSADDFNKLEIANSAIINNKTISGTKDSQVALAQENDTRDITGHLYSNKYVELINNGKIKLTGKNSSAIYAKNGLINNNSDIEVGEDSVALYGLDDTNIANNGDIKIAKNSVGIFSKNLNTQSVINNRNISSDGDDAVGIYMDADMIGGRDKLINKGTISLSGKHETGIYAKGNLYKPVNKGKIILGDSDALSTPNIGMYTTDKENLIINDGLIKTGKNSIGIFGYNITQGDSIRSNPQIDVDTNSIGIYSQDGEVFINSGTMNLSHDSKGMYINGKNGKITNNLDNMNFNGDNIIGVVIGGSENEFNSQLIGSPSITPKMQNIRLKNSSIYVYSKDSKGHIYTHDTKIITDGNSNFGYYTSGNLVNRGDIDMSKGTGNIGIFSLNNDENPAFLPKATNFGHITVGASDPGNNKYSIGMAAGLIQKDNNANVTTLGLGHIINEGVIEVNKPDAIGMYGAGAGTIVDNQNKIILNGPRTTAMYLDEGARGENHGTIEITPDALDSTGVFLGKGTKFKNFGHIIIKNNHSYGQAILKSDNEGIIENGSVTSEIDPTFNGSQNIKELKATTDGNIKVGNIEFKISKGGTVPTEVYVNNKKMPVTTTSVVTNPITGEKEISVKTANGAVERMPLIQLQRFLGQNVLHTEDRAAIGTIGMYMDTTPKGGTNPIEGLNNLPSTIKEADLIIGTEVTNYQNSKTIAIDESILKRYNEMIKKAPNIKKWNIISGELLWTTKVGQMEGAEKIISIVMQKKDYTDFVTKDNNLYNFYDGLEQRYDKNPLNSREKKVFNLLNDIGNNEPILFNQATFEMLGNQYSNTLRRVMTSHYSYNREFNDLMKWQTNTKDTMKVKMWGETVKYSSKKPGLISYDHNSQGVFILNNNETVKLAQSSGFFGGIANEQFKFKDIGGSKERAITGQLGYYKSIPYGYNNEINWTWKAGIEGSYRHMTRRYLVVSDIFQAKSQYNTYGAFLDNTLGKNYRVSEKVSIEPYAGLNLAVGKVQKIHENKGEVRLDLKSKDYYSILPNAGIKVKYSTPLAVTNIVSSLDLNLSKELGDITNNTMKARVNRTTANYYNLTKDKKDNASLDITGRIGIETQGYGISLKAGYSTSNKNINGGLEFRVKF